MPPSEGPSSPPPSGSAPARAPQRWRRYIGPGGAVLFVLLLLVPQIGSFGFWDPQETRLADQAKGLVSPGGLAVPGYIPPLEKSHLPALIGGSVDGHPLLQTVVVGEGLLHVGMNETGGRLPLLLASLLTLALVLWIGVRLRNLTTGLLAMLVLASAPLFSMQARQLVSSAVPALLVTAAFAAGLWLVEALARERKRRAVLAGVLLVPALAASALASGLLLGVGVPLLAVAFGAALFAAGEPRAERPPRGRWALWGAVAVLGAGGGACALIGLEKLFVPGGAYYSFAVGGIPNVSRPAATGFEYFLKQVGFGFFPWVALLVPALGSLIGATARGARSAGPSSPAPGDGAPAADTRRLVQAAVGGWAVVAFALGTLYARHAGDLLFPALPALALGVGDVLADRLEDGGSRALTALAAGLVAVTVARDFFLYPQDLAFVHVFNPPTFPTDLTPPMPPIFLGFGIAFAVVLALEMVPPPASLAGRFVRLRRAWARITTPRAAVGAVLAVGVAFGLFTSQVLTPKISTYFSQREVFEMYHACAQGNEPVAEYDETGAGVRYYGGGMKVESLGSMSQLLAFLRRPTRVFVIIPASQLPSANEAALRAGVPLHVVLPRGRSLLLSNQLGGKCTQDQNDLLRLQSRTAPRPQHPVSVTWSSLVANNATPSAGGHGPAAVQLIGWDAPSAIAGGSTLRFTMYFKVLAPLPAGYKIFMHFDAVSAAVRFQGDHDVCGGKLPLQNWTPGMYVTDTYDIDVGGTITGGVPAGDYTIYMGFWQGDDRLEIVNGPNDGKNRAILGTLHVR